MAIKQIYMYESAPGKAFITTREWIATQSAADQETFASAFTRQQQIINELVTTGSITAIDFTDGLSYTWADSALAEAGIPNDSVYATFRENYLTSTGQTLTITNTTI